MDGHRHQLWFDDARSFGLKCDEAKKLGYHGIGIWVPEMAETAEQAKEMWAAIPWGGEQTTANLAGRVAGVKTDDDGGTQPPTTLLPAIDIGDSIQLFADDLLVASSTNLTRTMHSPAVVQVAIAADAPWEKEFTIGIIGTSVVMDGDKIRIWYQLRNNTLGCGHGDQPSCADGLPPEPNYEPSGGFILTAYAESTDGGRTFVKPLLHRYMLAGSTANNIIGFVFFEPGSKHKGNLTHLNSIFIDRTQPSNSPRRFRGVSSSVPYFSLDGFNWTLGEPWSIPADPLFDGDWGTTGFDTQGEVFWDPPCANGKGCYSFYTRFKNESPRPPPHFRMVRRARSFKFDTPGADWTNQSIVMRADALDNSTHKTEPDASIPAVDY